MSTDLELLRQQAEEFERLRQAPELLRQAEVEQREQVQREQAHDNVAELEVELDSLIASFNGTESEVEYRAWLRQGRGILERRMSESNKQIGAIVRTSEALAKAKFECGMLHSPMVREHANKEFGKEEIRARTGDYYLMSQDSNESELKKIVFLLTASPAPPTRYPMPETGNPYRR